jgi:hypothetical protein
VTEVTATLAARNTLPADKGEAARIVDVEVRERVRRFGRCNVSRAVSDLVRAGPHSPSLSGLPGRPSQSRRSAGGCLHNHGGGGRCASGTQLIERARRPLAAIRPWRCHSLGDPQIQAYMTICRL